MYMFLQLVLPLLLLQVAFVGGQETAPKKLKINRLCSTGTCDDGTCAATEEFEIVDCKELSDGSYQKAVCDDNGWLIHYYRDAECKTELSKSKRYTWNEISSDAVGCNTLKRAVFVLKSGASENIYINICGLTKEDQCKTTDRTACSSITISQTSAETCTSTPKGLYYTSSFDSTTMTVSIYRTEEECNAGTHKMVFIDKQAVPSSGSCSAYSETVNAVCGDETTTTTTETTTTETTTTETTTTETTTIETTTETAEGANNTEIDTDPSANDDNTTSFSGRISTCAGLLLLFAVLGLMN